MYKAILLLIMYVAIPLVVSAVTNMNIANSTLICVVVYLLIGAMYKEF